MRQKTEETWQLAFLPSAGAVVLAGILGSLLAGLLWAIAGHAASVANDYSRALPGAGSASGSSSSLQFVPAFAPLLLPLVAGSVAVWLMQAHLSAHTGSWFPLRAAVTALALAAVANYALVSIAPGLGRPVIPLPLLGLSGAYLFSICLSWVAVYLYAARRDAAEAGDDEAPVW